MAPIDAYKLIRSNLSMDSKPAMNVGTFLTTELDDESLRLMEESNGKNYMDFHAYPETNKISGRCKTMVARLYHAYESNKGYAGCSVLGSSEGIMLGVLAAKFRWRENRQKAEKDCSKPNIVFGTNAHICWKKAAIYLDVEIRTVPVDNNTLVMQPKDAIKKVDENTVAVGITLGDMFTGIYENVHGLNELIDVKMKSKEWDVGVSEKWSVGINVDAATGGFVAPFIAPFMRDNDPYKSWDFALDHVAFINVSAHKYGLTYPGLGWALWRHTDFIPQRMILPVDYIGGDTQETYTLNFSKSSSQVLAQYYTFIRYGQSGMQALMVGLLKTTEYFRKEIDNLVHIHKNEDGTEERKKVFKIYSSDKVEHGVPMVSFSLLDWPKFDENKVQLSAFLRQRGWIVPAFKKPVTESTSAAKLKNGLEGRERELMMRVIVRTDLSKGRISQLVSDITDGVNQLASNPSSYRGDISPYFPDLLLRTGHF
ncbi:hypothetical protein DFQ28_010463 [Apophysomyces sp. BC1034]|nr:hypothetical protein DFQ28_010463 [Apophysomyces sp. BC1034]